MPCNEEVFRLRKELNEQLKEQIKSIHEKNRRVYGSPRVHNELKKQGKKCSRRRVAKLMKEEGIQAKMRKRWKKTTCVNEKTEPSANYLDQNFTTEEPNEDVNTAAKSLKNYQAGMG